MMLNNILDYFKWGHGSVRCHSCRNGSKTVYFIKTRWFGLLLASAGFTITIKHVIDMQWQQCKIDFKELHFSCFFEWKQQWALYHISVQIQAHVAYINERTNNGKAAGAARSQIKNSKFHVGVKKHIWKTQNGLISCIKHEEPFKQIQNLTVKCMISSDWIIKIKRSTISICL